MSEKNKKPGFFQKLFGSGSKHSDCDSSCHVSPATDGASSSRPKPARSTSDNTQKPSNSSSTQKPSSGSAGVKNKPTSQSARPAGGSSSSTGDSSSRPKPPRHTTSDPGNSDPRRKSRGATGSTSSTGAAGKKSRRRKGNKKINVAALANLDTSRPLEFPATPETILAHHKNKPFLNKNEEWLLVELNEFECLVDSIDIIKTIAKHSQFFEVEPDELWEEFFELVEEMPTYDDIINMDVWQEFRDARYPC